MTVGIYRITNLINGKLYFGQSVDVEKRLGEHKRNEKHNDHLTNSINKYGVENFTFELEIATSIPYLNRLEKLFIRKYDTTNHEKGYNKDSGGGANYVMSDETKRKISEANKGHDVSDETKRKISKAHKGKILSDEHRKKLSEAAKGKHHSEEIKQKMSEVRNTSGYLNVYKNKTKECKQGFVWKYTYYEDGKQKAISSVDIEKLKQKVKAKGLKWLKFEGGD